MSDPHAPAAPNPHEVATHEADPVEAVTSVIPIVLPIVGGVMMFLLAFIAVSMA
ncbi:hypothetical protein [Pseudorhodoferax sp.]|uniref:hypothetical protein n=1 Tax=Pseudorhodoferax sp. TaxID=1993553 RepID=UPI0039E4E853